MTIAEMFADLRKRYQRPIDRDQRRCIHPRWRPSTPFQVRWFGDSEWTTINNDQEVCTMCGLTRFR